MTPQVKAFGPRLKWWREQRALSQLALSGAAEISQRHLSFLESGVVGRGARRHLDRRERAA